MPDDKAPGPPNNFKLSGVKLDATLPAALVPELRAAGGATRDPFLPDDYLIPVATYDVSTVARGAPDVRSHDLTPSDEQLIVFELADGSTFVTGAARLRDTIRLTHPELLEGDTILLEKFRATSAAAGRGFGEALTGIIHKIYVLATAGPDKIINAVMQGGAFDALTWAGTRLLVETIEQHLERKPGLYRWVGGTGTDADLQALDPADQKSGDPGPMLVFIHGTGSNTLGSFGSLCSEEPALWDSLKAVFGSRICAFEHLTLSKSPIENAIDLVEALPQGAHVCLATHSRGGLIGDLLCLDDLGSFVDDYRFRFEGVGEPDQSRADKVRGQLDEAHEEQRGQLRKLANLLAERNLVIERYVRTASPASGTLLASGNFDLFLSSLLTLIGTVPFLMGSPIYSAFKRALIEIVKNRTDPHLVPGIEAMLPDSPMAQLLRDARPRPGIKMGLIAGDVDGGNMLARLGVLLTDFLFFNREDNDMVVNTRSMLGGIAAKAGARVLFDRGARVTHFRYFTNPETRKGLREWFANPTPEALESFRDLPKPEEYAKVLAGVAASRGAGPSAVPVVVVLPGIMGSDLAARSSRVWFDLLNIARGGLGRIAWGQSEIAAQDLFPMTYGRICRWLSASHRVEQFAYDWRQPLDTLGNQLGVFLGRLMKEVPDQPIRLLAHSMGGLVVRACMYQYPQLMQELMARDGARLVMLGTPNQGAHSMVENLLGKGDTLRKLARLDLEHKMQEVLDIVAGFRGALQLLPAPRFTDTFQGQPDGGDWYHYQSAQTWVNLKDIVTDFWFGDKCCGTPAQAALKEASWLWDKDEAAGGPALPQGYANKCVYVFGVAPATPCGVRVQTDGNGAKRLKMVATSSGDGTVTWDSGRISGIGSFYYMPALHGDLPATSEYFPALAELLATGATSLLSRQPPALRAIQQAGPVSYDAGPPEAVSPEAMQTALVGGSLQPSVAGRPAKPLRLRVKAMDLRFLAQPIMIGHYDQDPIAGPEALVDKDLLGGDLRKRYDLGLYAGQRGTCTVVLNARPDDRMTGAVIVGLGPYDGSLTAGRLTESVRAGALRYLLQVVDVLGKGDREVPLASLLIGYHSSANLSVAASVEAIVRGVLQANERFADTTGLNIRIASLELVEAYLDTAITAVYALRQLAKRLTAQASSHAIDLMVCDELARGEGVRMRLRTDDGAGYWPRLIVGGLGENAENCPPPAAGTKAGAAFPPSQLRYLYLGTRARAEGVVEQRQPGLVDALVRQQIDAPAWDRDFGRMLFQLMVPYEFKDPARQLDRLVLVVDGQTANLPWELMLSDDPAAGEPEGYADADDPARLPLALRVAVVRQLTSSRFRPRVIQASGRQALVIGNPSVKGFGAAFTMPDAGAAAVRSDPPPLPGALDEANAVADLLEKLSFRVQRVVGHGTGDAPAKQVLAALYRRPWRILHISGHGVFDLPHPDGQRRSGVLLSDGLLITGAEIAAMETVPELVFLNCCHSGQIDEGRSSNKLAAGIARELIDIGVRCVVVAGWAVNDDSASRFGEAFYQELLAARHPFGEAVFNARKAAWSFNRQDITWGAFQAYGDPAWRADPQADGTAAETMLPERFGAVEELLDELATIRDNLARRAGGATTQHGIDPGEIDKLLANLPPEWRRLPQLRASLAETWLELGQLERARAEYAGMFGCDELDGAVPLDAVMRLAHVEALLGEGEASTAIASGDAQALSAARARIMDALKLLEKVDETAGTLAARNASAGGAWAPAAARAGVWKILAGVSARQLLKTPGADAGQVRQQMNDNLARALEAYKQAEDACKEAVPSTLELDRLALQAVMAGFDGQASREALERVNACARRAATRRAANDDANLEVLAGPAAMLAMALVNKDLGKDGDAGQRCYAALGRAYLDATGNLILKPSAAAALVADLEGLARFAEACATGAGVRSAGIAADRLRLLAQGLAPGEQGSAENQADATTAPQRARVPAGI